MIITKRFFKTFISSAAVFMALSQAFSVETGGLLTNDSKLANVEKDGSLKLDQKNGVNFWLRAPLNEEGTSYFAGEASFQTEYDTAETDSDKKLKLYADLNLFKFVFKNELDSGNIQFSLGRFFNSDLTGLVYSQNADGLRFDANLPRVALTLFGSYTGLLNAKTVSMLEIDSPDTTDKEKTVYVLAHKYAVGGLTFSLPHFAAGQTLSLEGLATLSLESTKYNRFYGTFALNGPIVSPVFYSISSTIGFAKYDEQDMVKGNLSKASISVYPDFKSMSVSLNGVYASGKQGPFEAFQGFTSSTAANSLSEPEYSGILKAGLSATIKPVSNLLLSAGGDVLFTTIGGEESNKIEQAGFQYSAGFNWQIVSDVSLGANFLQYIGKEDYETQFGAGKTQLKISAAIAF